MPLQKNLEHSFGSSISIQYHIYFLKDTFLEHKIFFNYKKVSFCKKIEENTAKRKTILTFYRTLKVCLIISAQEFLKSHFLDAKHNANLCGQCHTETI